MARMIICCIAVMLFSFPLTALGGQIRPMDAQTRIIVSTLLSSGCLMIAVGLIYVIAWKAKMRVPLRWFWAGAGIWAVGVLLKFLFAIALNKPILAGLEHALPRVGYLIVGSLYIGLLTGVFEIGITLLAAYYWRSLALNAGRAVAVGIGAGSFEAILLGLSTVASIGMIFINAPEGVKAQAVMMNAIATTPFLWLAGPFERIMAVLCHAASRSLGLISIARSRRVYFWYGFILMTALDGIAGYFHLTEQVGNISTWWIELTILPFALVSIPIISWCIRNWPREEAALGKYISQEHAPAPQ